MIVKVRAYNEQVDDFVQKRIMAVEEIVELPDKFVLIKFNKKQIEYKKCDLSYVRVSEGGSNDYQRVY